MRMLVGWVNGFIDGIERDGKEEEEEDEDW